jgi:hypothetical protein
MPDLVAADSNAFVDLAVALPHNPEEIIRLKRRISQDRLIAPLFRTVLPPSGPGKGKAGAGPSRNTNAADPVATVSLIPRRRKRCKDGHYRLLPALEEKL